MNINVPGKSGHFFYNNYNRSTKEAIWHGRPGTHSDQPLMQRLIKNQSSPIIFARWNNSDDFTFIGRGNYISHENGAIETPSSQKSICIWLTLVVWLRFMVCCLPLEKALLIK